MGIWLVALNFHVPVSVVLEEPVSVEREGKGGEEKWVKKELRCTSSHKHKRRLMPRPLQGCIK